MQYQDGTAVKFGDIIYISTQDRFVTVEEDGSTISVKALEDNGTKHKILVCGNQKLDGFYLTFKYNRGFLTYDGKVLASGGPWTERTIFDLALLKKAIGVDEIVFTKCDHIEEEDH